MTHYSLSGLIGASKNLAGYKEGEKKKDLPLSQRDPSADLSGHNLEWSKRGSTNAFTVIRVDEADKLCIEAWSIFLSIVRDGVYTLQNGEIVDFRHCIIIFTSNAGSKEVEAEQQKHGIGFGPDGTSTNKVLSRKEIENFVNKALMAQMPPEMRARIKENGEIVIFNELTEEDIKKIRDLKVDELRNILGDQEEITIEVDESARAWLLTQAGSVAELNNAVKTHLADVIVNQLLLEDCKIGDDETVSVTTKEVDGEEVLHFTVTVPPSAPKFLYIASGIDEVEQALLLEARDSIRAKRELPADQVDKVDI